MSRIGRAYDRFVAMVDGRGAIFMYHRIASPDVDPWQLSVDPARFESQLDYLASAFDVVPLREIATRVRKGRSVRGLAAITFDDGYADNALVAQPMLARRSLPATYFVTTSVLDGTSRFWWDELEDVFLRRESLPERFEFVAGSETIAIDLADDARLDASRRDAIAAWNASKPHPNRRTESFHRVWSALKELSPTERRRALDAIALATNGSNAASTRIPTMDRAMLGRLAREDGVEIGAHGVTHLALPHADPTTRGFEIGTSKSTLEDVLHRRVDGFAYPNGALDATTPGAVAAAGYVYAVTTSGDPITTRARPYELGRIHVGNWDVARLERATRNAIARRRV